MTRVMMKIWIHPGFACGMGFFHSRTSNIFYTREGLRQAGFFSSNLCESFLQIGSKNTGAPRLFMHTADECKTSFFILYPRIALRSLCRIAIPILCLRSTWKMQQHSVSRFGPKPPLPPLGCSMYVYISASNDLNDDFGRRRRRNSKTKSRTVPFSYNNTTMNYTLHKICEGLEYIYPVSQSVSRRSVRRTVRCGPVVVVARFGANDLDRDEKYCDVLGLCFGCLEQKEREREKEEPEFIGTIISSLIFSLHIVVAVVWLLLDDALLCLSCQWKKERISPEVRSNYTERGTKAAFAIIIIIIILGRPYKERVERPSMDVLTRNGLIKFIHGRSSSFFRTCFTPLQLSLLHSLSLCFWPSEVFIIVHGHTGTITF